MSLKDFRRQLVDVLRERTLLTSVKRLKKKGQHNVRVLRLADLGPLLEETVERIIEDRGLDVTEAERQEIQTEARNEVTLLLQEHREVLADRDRIGRERDRLRRKVSTLRKELERQTQLLEKERARVVDESSLRLEAEELARFQDNLMDAIDLAVRQKRREGVIDADDSVMDDLVKATREAATNVIDVESRASTDRERQAHLEHVDELERRLDELRSALQDSEDAYDRIAEIASGS
ncbi:MAG: hypothetical protein RL885_26815 [Planctomycetota bacterium]